MNTWSSLLAIRTCSRHANVLLGKVTAQDFADAQRWLTWGSMHLERKFIAANQYLTIMMNPTFGHAGQEESII